MDNEITDTISKEEIAGLEVEYFTGCITVVDTLDKVDAAVKNLEKQKLIGFDTETRPSFKKGKINKVALLQLSTEKTCFLFRLNMIGFPESLLNLLKNEKITKVGLSLQDDFGMLHKIAPIEPAGFIDIQTYVKRFKIKEMSLQKIYARLFHKKISKHQRLSNWEAEKLNDGQKRYAATDAWACILIYKKLKEMEPQCETPANNVCKTAVY